MKTITKATLAVLSSILGMLGAHAQGFSSGSNGSYGPLNITSNTTLDLPADGIFHCTTINIAQNFTLRFNRNPLNTPVYLLATSNVTIVGTIDVSGSDSSPSIPDGGRGGPGGYDGGKPAFGASVRPGAGYGPGAGRGGLANNTVPSQAGGASYSSVGASGNSTNKGAVYGSPLLIPLVGGSGGGGTDGNPGRGGGGGGGAILISSSTRIDIPVTGRIYANGGAASQSFYGPGSGGGIRLVAPVVAGTGQLHANGANGYAGDGRIRVDSINRTQLQLTFSPLAATSVGSTMFVFPTTVPRLDILEAAGTQIPEGTPTPIFVQLPFGSSQNKTVTVQARDFNANVPIRVVLTPDNGDPITYDAVINNQANNPATAVVNVVFPVNVHVNVSAWTR